MSGKKVSFTHSRLLVELTDTICHKIDKITEFLFFEFALYIIPIRFHIYIYFHFYFSHIPNHIISPYLFYNITFRINSK